jgi:hypothetical protein
VTATCSTAHDLSVMFGCALGGALTWIHVTDNILMSLPQPDRLFVNLFKTKKRRAGRLLHRSADELPRLTRVARGQRRFSRHTLRWEPGPLDGHLR